MPFKKNLLKLAIVKRFYMAKFIGISFNFFTLQNHVFKRYAEIEIEFYYSNLKKLYV